ncbi:hypothetical protein VTJ49DRAFT_5961 [Mycothermus thermophilus]|uniref:Major facilitator superfamily (MFS) profile domain-containing protein n=1 Tax=Humicola insolens TaxID=85995 RepID=A0ABR3V257_HUMIN
MAHLGETQGQRPLDTSRNPNDDEKKLTRPPDTSDAESSKAAVAVPDSEEAFPPAPEGGLRAWLVVVGSACIFFSCLGFMNSFGVFQAYYMSHQLRHRSPDDIAWLGSLTMYIQFAGGVVAGPLFDRFGAWVIRPGAVIYILALMMTSLCKEYWQFMLAQGVLAGIGMSLLQVPAFAAVSQYFDKRRAAALGLVVSGSSIGGIVFPIALSKMLNDSTLGFGWSVRVMGFVITPLLGFSVLTVQARLPPRKTRFFLWSAFREVKFLLLIAATFFSFVGMMTPVFYLPTHAILRGMEPTLASYLLAIVNAASTFGRVIPGVLADKFGRLNVFGAGGLATGVVVLCMNSAVNTAGLVVYSIVFGFTSGTIISGASAAISICTEDQQTLGTYLGMGMAVASTAFLFGPPVNGVLLDRYGGFKEVTIFSGVLCLVGGISVIATKLATPKGLLGRV